MKPYLLSLFLLLFFYAGGRQVITKNSGQFSGSIIANRTHKSLSSATITVISSGKKYICDNDGKFRLPELVSGKYLLRISSMGYKDLVKEITIPGSGYFALEEAEAELEQVVVTAVAGATKIKRTPISIAIVSQKEMNKSTGTNVIDALLRAVPGISSITTGPNISKPFIRGLGYNRVLTLYDGIRQEGQQWGDEHGIEIDQYGVARAEIVKGPASLLYGSDAIAGVVNLIPGLPAETEGRINGDALTEYQWNNGLIGATAALQYHKDGFLWSTRSSVKTATNYRNSVDGWVYNTGFKETNFSAMMGLEGPSAKNYLHVNLYDNLQEIPDGSRDSITRAFTFQTNETGVDDIRDRHVVAADRLHTYQTSPLHQHIQHYRVYHKGYYTLGNGELSTIIGFQQNIRREYNHPTAPAQAGLNVRLNTLNYEIKYSLPEWQGIHFTYGINGMYQENKNKDATDFPIPDYQLFDIGTYLLAKKEFGKFVISGGLRLDNRNINWKNFFTRKEGTGGFTRQVHLPDTASATLAFPSYKQQFSGLSASIGLVYTASNTITFKANIAKGYRSPSIPEIGSDGLDPGARIYYKGNRDFNPEFNWQTDMGIFMTYPDVDVTLELFNNNIANYIFFQKLFDANGQPLEIVPGNFTYQYKQGSARLFGAEAAWILHPKTISWLNLQQNISTITGINTDRESLKILGNDAKYLPLIPPFKTVSRLRISLPQKSVAITDCFLQTEVETNAAQNNFYAVDNTETKTNGYVLINAGAGFSINTQKDKTACRLVFNVNNLFDVAYQSHQNRLKYFEYFQTVPNGRSGIYNMGRNIAVKVIFNW